MRNGGERLTWKEYGIRPSCAKGTKNRLKKISEAGTKKAGAVEWARGESSRIIYHWILYDL